MTRRYESPLFATLAGIADRLRPNAKDGELRPQDRLDGKVAFVTGAASGLGLAIAGGLAERGAKVLMGSRRHDEAALARIGRVAQGPAPELVSLDLARFESIHRCANELKDTQLDITVLNAGVVPAGARRTQDAFEEGFQVNYLANVALLSSLLSSGSIGAPQADHDTKATTQPRPRIIFVTSESHRSGTFVPWSTLGDFYDYGMRDAVAEYGRTKLLLTTYAEALARRLGDDIGVYSFCPGAVRTNIAREAPSWSKPLLRVVFRAFFASPERAAEPALYLACAPRLNAETGVYLHRMTRRASSPEARDASSGERLWEANRRLLAALPSTR